MMGHKDPNSVCIVMPAYNEEGCIEEVLLSWASLMDSMLIRFEIVVVDDGSKDNTLNILNKLHESHPCITVIGQSNAGHGRALLNAYEKALSLDYNWVFHVDSDNQFDPEDFRFLWSKRDKSYFVMGKRHHREDPHHRLIISRVLAILLKIIFQTELKDANNPFRLIHRNYLSKVLSVIPKTVFAPNIFISLLAKLDNQEIFELPVRHTARGTGKISIVRFKLLIVCFRSLIEILKFRYRIKNILRSMNIFKYLIIGAGPCGLGAAYRLKEQGEENFLIIERNSYVGGLATSFKDKEGFTWDVGGHVLFSNYKYFDEVMKKAISLFNWIQHRRSAWIWMLNRFIPYPFQNNIHRLPNQERDECYVSLLDNQKMKHESKPKNFKEWCLRSFGAGITRLFMGPYNHKVWGTSPEEMSYQWIADRVSVINVENTIQNIRDDLDDTSWGPNETFLFPKKGGTGAIWESLSHIIGKDRLLLNSEVMSINPTTKRATLQSGVEIAYENIISTMPLPNLYKNIRGIKLQHKDISNKLQHTSSHIVGVGVYGQIQNHLKNKCWIYFPEKKYPFYRVTIFSNYSKNNVPDHKHHYSIMCEVCESKTQKINKNTIANQAISALNEAGIIGSDDLVISNWTHFEPFGYPIPTIERDDLLSKLIPELEQHHIYSRGRFGGWKYEVANMDHSFMQGKEWADFMIDKKKETTYTL